jgi:hypothetical protein
VVIRVVDEYRLAILAAFACEATAHLARDMLGPLRRDDLGLQQPVALTQLG